MKKKCLFILIFFVYNIYSYSQEYQWTGNSNTEDFFDELNWKETTTDELPPNNSINAGQLIEFQLYLTCSVIADGEIILGENGKISITDGELNANSITGMGEIILNESSYLNLNESYPLSEGTTISINSNKSWIRMNNLDPQSALYYYSDNIFYENQELIYPNNVRYDNYYNYGCVIRLDYDEISNLTVYSDYNLGGNFANINNSTVYINESIPNNLNKNISSFKLERGYMVTFAENDDGTGNSKVFIASEDDVIVENLSTYLNNKISFIRVVPWNWVTKKGTGGDVLNMNNNWFYKWSYNGSSDIFREYAPMAWGKGAADEENDIEIFKNKYKSTHLLAFNEPDDCNGQSGQYGNMCVTDTSLTYYKNLLKTGLRMVSPACRQDAVFNWLQEFNSKAVDNKIRIDVIAVHWYDWNSNPQNSPNENPQDVFNRFVNYLEDVYELYGLPIWITEFNANRYRNEWVHRQFLQLALPYLEQTEFVERYAFFPPVTDVADFFDINNDHTLIGQYYHDFISSKTINNDKYSSPSNLNIDTSSFYQLECDPENTFLSNYEIINSPKIHIHPNPSSRFINISINEQIRSLKIIGLNGNLIKQIDPKKNIDISFLEKGMYLLKINNEFVKFLKK